MATKKTSTAKSTPRHKPDEMVDIAPVVGHFLNGVPAVPQTLPAKEAEQLVKTGAFAFAAKPKTSAKAATVKADDTDNADTAPLETASEPEAVADEPSEAEPASD